MHILKNLFLINKKSEKNKDLSSELADQYVEIANLLKEARIQQNLTIKELSDISKIKDWITDAFFLSKLPVGSSRNKNLGFVTIALAIATLCFSPPDNFHGR